MTTAGLQVIAFTTMVSVAYAVYRWWLSRATKRSAREEHEAMQTWEGEGGNIAVEPRPADTGGATVHPT